MDSLQNAPVGFIPNNYYLTSINAFFAEQLIERECPAKSFQAFKDLQKIVDDFNLGAQTGENIQFDINKGKNKFGESAVSISLVGNSPSFDKVLLAWENKFEDLSEQGFFEVDKSNKNCRKIIIKTRKELNATYTVSATGGNNYLSQGTVADCIPSYLDGEKKLPIAQKQTLALEYQKIFSGMGLLDVERLIDRVHSRLCDILAKAPKGRVMDYIVDGFRGAPEIEKLMLAAALASIMGRYAYGNTSDNSTAGLFDAVQEAVLNGSQIPAGICADIHTAISQLLERLGIDSGGFSVPAHYISAGRLSDGLFFILDYGRLFFGRNRDEAMSCYQRQNRDFSLRNRVADSNGRALGYMSTPLGTFLLDKFSGNPFAGYMSGDFPSGKNSLQAGSKNSLDFFAYNSQKGNSFWSAGWDNVDGQRAAYALARFGNQDILVTVGDANVDFGNGKIKNKFIFDLIAREKFKLSISEKADLFLGYGAETLLEFGDRVRSLKDHGRTEGFTCYDVGTRLNMKFSGNTSLNAGVNFNFSDGYNLTKQMDNGGIRRWVGKGSILGDFHAGLEHSSGQRKLGLDFSLRTSNLSDVFGVKAQYGSSFGQVNFSGEKVVRKGTMGDPSSLNFELGVKKDLGEFSLGLSGIYSSTEGLSGNSLSGGF